MGLPAPSGDAVDGKRHFICKAAPLTHTLRRRCRVGISSCVDLNPSVPPIASALTCHVGARPPASSPGLSIPVPSGESHASETVEAGRAHDLDSDLGWLDFQLGHFLTGGLASLSLSVLLGGLGWGVGRRQCTEHQSKTPRVTLPGGQLRMGERPRGLQDGPRPQRSWARGPGGNLLHLPALSPPTQQRTRSRTGSMPPQPMLPLWRCSRPAPASSRPPA